MACRHGEFARKLKAGLARCGEIQAVDISGEAVAVAEASAKNKIEGLVFKQMDPPTWTTTTAGSTWRRCPTLSTTSPTAGRCCGY